MTRVNEHAALYRGASPSETTRKLRGAFLAPHPDTPGWDYFPDTELSLDAHGQIVSVTQMSPTSPSGHSQGRVWLPGFVDTHVHFPQHRIIGSATGALLEWLERSVFPEERRFREVDHASKVAAHFTQTLLARGTTSAAIYSSSDPGATEQLFLALADTGLRGEVGLTLMDRGAPDELLLEAGAALEACERLIARWHNTEEGRLRFCMTPRFALSCSAPLLRGAGLLAEREGLLIQTHISENATEIEATREAFPEAIDYLDVYEGHGLLSDRSLFAHCIWLSEREWDRLAERGAAVSHCPDSNFFLGSGVMRIEEAKRRAIRVSLGSDVGAGRSLDMRRACSAAFDAARISGAQEDGASLLWRATRGGALALGHGDRYGAIEVGLAADLISVQLPEMQGALEVAFASKEPSQIARAICDAVVFRDDPDLIQEVVIAGRSCWRRRGEE
ncbi:MAG: guanine deaminase [Myxococcota bacterium]|nr:guanine deaminase [Myxococcota bacterium]